MQQLAVNEDKLPVAALDFCSNRRQTFGSATFGLGAGWLLAAENPWNGMGAFKPWLNLSKSTNHTEGKSPNPAEPRPLGDTWVYRYGGQGGLR